MSRIKILSSIIIIFSIFVFSNLTYSQDTSKIQLTGKIISDKEDVLTSVLVTLKNYTTPESYTSVTDENGFYFFEVSEGRYIISIERNGFEKYSQVINAEKSSSNIFNITLIEKSTYTTEQITVESEFRQRQEDLRTSMYNVLPTEVKMLPGAIEDVMRSLKSLPGVTAPNDFTSQLVVRGSGPDQNLIVMDDVEIFNPYRLYGLVSMFNPETLQDITLITGGFP
ncbi:MAG: carboxypeptidase regulatory-like domain-containing protein, partial [Ignavibacteria bacterium]|nr:carboxypeptidase regulatory-like domain-containing protein [Ignavibacteria bacterium]